MFQINEEQFIYSIAKTWIRKILQNPQKKRLQEQKRFKAPKISKASKTRLPEAATATAESFKQMIKHKQQKKFGWMMEECSNTIATKNMFSRPKFRIGDFASITKADLQLR